MAKDNAGASESVELADVSGLMGKSVKMKVDGEEVIVKFDDLFSERRKDMTADARIKAATEAAKDQQLKVDIADDLIKWRETGDKLPAIRSLRNAGFTDTQITSMFEGQPPKREAGPPVRKPAKRTPDPEDDDSDEGDFDGYSKTELVDVIRDLAGRHINLEERFAKVETGYKTAGEIAGRRSRRGAIASTLDSDADWAKMYRRLSPEDREGLLDAADLAVAKRERTTPWTGTGERVIREALGSMKSLSWFKTQLANASEEPDEDDELDPETAEILKRLEESSGPPSTARPGSHQRKRVQQSGPQRRISLADSDADAVSRDLLKRTGEILRGKKR